MAESNRVPEPHRGIASLVFIKLPHLITGTLLLIAIAINIANVIGRYVFGSAIFWTEEILLYILVWSVFIAAATITYRGEHLCMDLFVGMIRSPWKQILNGISAALFVACCAVVLTQSYKVFMLHYQNGTESMAAGLPMTIPHGAFLLGFALMLVAVLLRIRAYVSGKFD